MRFDLVYREIGEFGVYQKYIVFVGSLTSFYAGLLFVNSFFILAVPDHRCALPGWENDTFSVQSAWHRSVINVTIPTTSPAQDRDSSYDHCRYYEYDPGTKEMRTVKCDAWVYDTSIFQTTLAADFNMVCDRSIMKSNAQMVFFGGLLAGSFLTGLFSDRFGRKFTMCLSSLFYFVVAMSIVWTPNYVIYVTLTFCLGFFAVGNFMPAYVMGMEFVGPRRRRYPGLVGGYHWMAGNVLLAVLGYSIRKWALLQLVCATPGILFQLWWIYFPESPRWLYSRGRSAEAEEVIKSAAKWNKAKLPDKFFDNLFQKTAIPIQGKLWQLFTSRKLCLRTLVLFFNWFVVCLAYYGLALNSGDIGGDLYLNFFLQALMDFPATTITLLLLDRSGRKPLLVGSMMIGGFGCLATVFTIMYGGSEYQIATTVLAMLGKVGASAAFSMVYVYSAELFPTVVRNAGLGSCSCMARVGGMVAPYIADSDRLIGGNFGKALPQVVFGCLSITAGITALYLPETLHKHLPETLEEAEHFGSETNSLASLDSGSHINKAFDESTTKTYM